MRETLAGTGALVRLGLRSPRSVEDEFGGDVEGLAEVFPRYRAEQARRGAVDFLTRSSTN